MVRTYKKKTEIVNISNAISDIVDNRISIRQASSVYNIKKSIIHDRLKKRKNDSGNGSGEEDQDQISREYAARSVFNSQEEVK